MDLYTANEMLQSFDAPSKVSASQPTQIDHDLNGTEKAQTDFYRSLKAVVSSLKEDQLAR